MIVGLLLAGARAVCQPSSTDCDNYPTQCGSDPELLLTGLAIVKPCQLTAFANISIRNCSFTSLSTRSQGLLLEGVACHVNCTLQAKAMALRDVSGAFLALLSNSSQLAGTFRLDRLVLWSQNTTVLPSSTFQFSIRQCSTRLYEY
jgi:hypothetical protein